ncbi:MAG: hypothetical protein IKJ77_06375 [Firmicutes bacterium]|nr:hypothetical protein [Bacillota bacterium]
MKLKVTATAFFDKKEQKYIYKKDTPTIEREEERAKQLIAAGVCEELDERDNDSDEIDPNAETPVVPTDETPEEAMPEPEDKEAEKPKKKK